MKEYSRDKWGTSYFPTLADAYKYYKTMGYYKHDVLNKVQAGEIHIGEPAIKNGQGLLLMRDHGNSKRWFISQTRAR